MLSLDFQTDSRQSFAVPRALIRRRLLGLKVCHALGELRDFGAVQGLGSVQACSGEIPELSVLLWLTIVAFHIGPHGMESTVRKKHLDISSSEAFSQYAHISTNSWQHAATENI